MKVKIVETQDQRLLDPARSESEKLWLEQNREAFAHYNRRVAKHGLLSNDACDERPLTA